MKILVISPAKPDYQGDGLLHGLRSLYGPDVVDYPRVDYMYRDYGDISHLYGRGFTLFGLLGDDSLVDRNNIIKRISEREFDFIIYSSIHRDQGFLDSVTKSYPREKIIFIDGEDQPYTIFGMEQHGVYFKRELAAPRDRIYPIHFGIPASKIGTCGPLLKKKVRADIDPRDRSTYIYQREEGYYRDYHESLFAITCKKAGWDCMRHLEILANGCIPLFLDIDKCPETICTHLPKPELLEALTLMDKHVSYWDTTEGHNVWLSLWRRIHLKFARYCTTEALARYVIETAQKESAQ